MNPRKIVATTNKRIGIEREKAGDNTWEDRYPKPSKSFVEKYEALGTIKNVLVDYEYITGEELGSDPAYYNNPIKLKVDKHNEISIHPIKTSWSRKEVSDLLLLAMATASAYGMDMDEINAKDWIKHNL